MHLELKCSSTFPKKNEDNVVTLKGKAYFIYVNSHSGGALPHNFKFDIKQFKKMANIYWEVT